MQIGTILAAKESMALDFLPVAMAGWFCRFGHPILGGFGKTVLGVKFLPPSEQINNLKEVLLKVEPGKPLPAFAKGWTSYRNKAKEEGRCFPSKSKTDPDCCVGKWYSLSFQ